MATDEEVERERSAPCALCAARLDESNAHGFERVSPPTVARGGGT
jgi:hypothetical protein